MSSLVLRRFWVWFWLVPGFLGAAGWLLVVLMGSFAGFSRPVDFIPTVCFLVVAGGAAGVARAKEARVLRRIVYSYSLFTALALEDFVICGLNISNNWHPIAGAALGLLLGLPLIAVTAAALLKLRLVDREATEA